MKTTVFTLIANLILISNIYSQKNADDYKQPAVIEGSSLNISGAPYYSYSKSIYDSGDSRINYEFSFSSHYFRYKFTERFNYLGELSLNARYSRFENNDININDLTSSSYSSTNSNLNLLASGGLSWYLPGTKFFAGAFSRNIISFSNHEKPFYTAYEDLNTGYGKFIDAYVINEAGDIENILLEDKYIKDKLSLKVRQKINNLLDKRRYGEFYYKYKDDLEIEFFTQLEKLLLNEKVISNPLNAQTTIKLYRALTSNKFLRYPIYKGWQAAADLSMLFYNLNEDPVEYPKNITFSGFYGLPLNNSTSVVFSTAVSIPVNRNSNSSSIEGGIYTPLLLRALYFNNYYEYFINPGFEGLPVRYYQKYDYKIFLQGYIFHNFNSNAALTGRLFYTAGKIKERSNFTGNFTVDIDFRYYILNSLSINSGLHYRQNSLSERFIVISSGIGYFIF